MLKLAVGSALLVTVTQGWAVSLGAIQGNVIIGRPLEVMVQSSIDASEAAAGLCLEAEVIYGDNRVSASAVTAAIHRIGADGTGALRVRVSEPVTEPFVTLVLKAGCQQTFRRSYTLLADLDMPVPLAAASRPAAGSVPGSQAVMPSAPRPVVRPAAAAPVAAVPAMPSATQVRPSSSASAGVVTPAPTSVPMPETPISLAAPAPRPPGVTSLRSKVRPAAALPRAEDVAPATTSRPPAPTPTPAPEAEGARLKLDPVDVSPTPGPASPNAPDAVPQVDATGAAQGDAADVASSSEVARELEQLRAEQEKLRLAMETMNAQLAQAEATRYQNPVVYGLGAAIVALLGGVWVLWRRRSRATVTQDAAVGVNPWWETSLPPEVPKANEQTAEVAPAAAWATGNPVSGLEVSDARESMFREVPIAPLNPEALLDVWQRVDFFESLGQHRDSMEALKDFVSENPRASEAPYLRWLALSRAHGQGEDHSLAQAFYEHHFQRLAPSAITEGHLESDAPAVQHLVAEWPEPTARRWLEQALASQPGDLATLQVRSTEVFDDLLTLLGTLDVLDALPETPKLPAAADQITPSAAPAVLAPDLNLDFPVWSTAAEAASKVEPASVTPPVAQAPEAEADRPPLDFDFFKWEPPAKPEDEPPPKA